LGLPKVNKGDKKDAPCELNVPALHLLLPRITGHFLGGKSIKSWFKTLKSILSEAGGKKVYN